MHPPLVFEDGGIDCNQEAQPSIEVTDVIVKRSLLGLVPGLHTVGLVCSSVGYENQDISGRYKGRHA